MREDFLYPILHALSEKYLVPELREGMVVLEIGAGTRGILRGIAGHGVPSGVVWRESDRDVGIYRATGRFETDKVLTALPALTGIANGSADVIAGLSVLDAISQKDLPSAFLSMARVLRQGGSVVQFFDIKQTFHAEESVAAEWGWIPFGYLSERPGKPGAFRIAYLRRRGVACLFEEMKRINAPAERVQVVQTLLDQPAVAWNSNGSESIAPKAALREIFAKLGLVAADHDAIELLTGRLRDAAEMAGFKVELSGEVPEELLIPRSTIREYPAELRLVDGAYGVVQMFAEDPGAPVPSDHVRVRFAAVVFTARKV